MLCRQAIANDSVLLSVESASLPEMAAISNVKLKKQTFFDFLTPIVDTINKKIQIERAWLKVIQADIEADHELNIWQQQLLNELAIRYKVNEEPGSPEFFQALFFRVDVLPASLVLAQAANESAWGTSRFAVEGNNLFGQWCFIQGCGLVPSGRDSDARHEVKVFDSVADSVKSYFQNINTHPQYQSLRAMRAEFRALQEPLDSTYLAWGLEGYSIRGEYYVRELINMINHNQLQGRDQPAYYAKKAIKVAVD
ncbi:MAG: glucosaminidase domain-containing protein [Reinekea sp.]|jgi:Bax protein